jgi:hypothetical protein
MNPLRKLLPWLVAAAPLAAAIEELRPKSGLSPLPYQQTPHPMPNYLAGQRWGTEGEKITRMQTPLTPDKSAERIVLRQGFQADL